jgi:LCP family protein required for cell wall assembly
MATPEDGRWVGRAAVTPASRYRYPTDRRYVTNPADVVATATATTTRPGGASRRRDSGGVPPRRTGGGGPPGGTGGGAAATGGSPRRRLRPRWGRIAIVGAVALTLVIGLISVATVLWVRNLDANLKRTDPFSQIAHRPQKLADGSLNILLLGSDSRDPDSQAGARTDTIMILHVPASHDKAYVISLPRDLWVHVPPSPDGSGGDTMAKLNAAYAWGGMPLMVQTVEQYTGVRMDHVVLIDFFGFVKVVDALGGVQMNVDQTITSIHPPHRVFTQGPHTFNGDEALDYIRQRYQYADGDFTREKHQQEFLKALLDKAAGAGALSNPARFKDFVSSTASALTVDESFSLVDLGWQFRGLRSTDLNFLTSPNDGGGTEGDQSVVVSDPTKAPAFYDAIAHDTLANYLATAGK